MKETVIKMAFVFLLASFAISFGMISADFNLLSHQANVTNCFPTSSYAANDLHVFDQSVSSPMAFIFQIIFILFFISPPLIVVLLFLIWKEMKERNKLK